MVSQIMLKPYNHINVQKIKKPMIKLAMPFTIGTRTDVPIIWTFSAWLVKLNDFLLIVSGIPNESVNVS